MASPGNKFLEVTAIFWSCCSFPASHWGRSQNMKFVLIFGRQHSAISAESIRLSIVTTISFWQQVQNLIVTSRKLFPGLHTQNLILAKTLCHCDNLGLVQKRFLKLWLRPIMARLRYMISALIHLCISSFHYLILLF